jgi:SH3-like domain-containing protein
MTDKSTQNLYVIRRRRNGVFINIIVKGYEEWQHIKRVQREQDKTRMQFKKGKQTIIINIVKRDKEVKVRLYRRYMSTKRK